MDPHKQLVITRGTGASVADVGTKRVEKCNTDLAESCEQAVVGHPRSHLWQDQVELRARGPVLRFNQAPGIAVGPDGSRGPMGDVIHVWTTRR